MYLEACRRCQRLSSTSSTCFNIHSVWWYGWKALSLSFPKLSTVVEGDNISADFCKFIALNACTWKQVRNFRTQVTVLETSWCEVHEPLHLPQEPTFEVILNLQVRMGIMVIFLPFLPSKANVKDLSFGKFLFKILYLVWKNCNRHKLISEIDIFPIYALVVQFFFNL